MSDVCRSGWHGRIAKIEELFSELDKGIESLKTAQAEALRQSILKKAFSGQLVPQDPQDEPAAALLASAPRNHRQPGSRVEQLPGNLGGLVM